MWLSEYFLWFLIYSCLGWCYETVYCTCVNGAWENRGFLFGPICPIYGCGGVAITALYNYMQQETGVTPTRLQVFLFAFFGSIVLEYGTSWILEKLFHACWWDYHNMPLNINGRVCLPASILFGLAGLLIIYVLMPIVEGWTSGLSPIGTEFVALITMGLLGADISLTVCVLTRFEEMVVDMEANVDLHMELFVQTVQEKTQDATQRLAAERERFSLRNMEESAAHLNSLHRSVLRRVAVFRPVKSPKQGQIVTCLHAIIQKRPKLVKRNQE